MNRVEILRSLTDIDRLSWNLPDEFKDEWDKDYYRLLKQINDSSDSELGEISKKLEIIPKMMKIKYGNTHKLIRMIPELSELLKEIDNYKMSLASDDLEKLESKSNSIIDNYINNIKKFDFLKNPYDNLKSREGLKLTLDSLKTILENENYLSYFSNKSKTEILEDYIKISDYVKQNDSYYIEISEGIIKEYKDGISKIWTDSLSDGIDKNNLEFKLLFSGINGPILDQANNLMLRKHQNSCSLISNDFMATFTKPFSRVGFIYPKDTKIICASAYDLNSNVLLDEKLQYNNASKLMVNAEKASYIATPDALINEGKRISKTKKQDVYYASSYSEVMIDSETKPCGVCMISMGEKDLNPDYKFAKYLADSLNISFTEINVLDYKKELTKKDEEYIAYNAIISALNIAPSQHNIHYVFDIMEQYGSQILEKYIEQNQKGEYTPENFISYVSALVSDYRLGGKKGI